MKDRLPQRAARARPLPPEAPSTSHRGRWGLLAFAYAALVVYGSLYPFSGWTTTSRLFAFLRPQWPQHWGRVDMLINVLAYVPLGFLLARAWGRRIPVAAAALLATLGGAALSFAMESAQQYLPSRVASLSDVLTNSLGTLLGGILAGFAAADSLTGEAFSSWRTRWVRPGRLADLGLIAIFLWVLSQLAPFVPTVDIGELRHGLAPLWATLHDPARFDFAQWGAYATDIAGLALLAQTLGRPDRSAMFLFFAFVACVLVLKAPIETRQLSLEAIAGALAAGIVAPLMKGMRLKALARAGALLILCGFAIAETAKGPSPIVYRFDWVPFTAQMEHPLIGILSILENLWPAAALAYLIRFACPIYRSRAVAWIAGLALTAAAFALEWRQQRIPGRIGDITTVLLMAGTWAVFWSVPLPAVVPPPIREAMPTPHPRARGTRAWMVAGALLFAAALVAGHVPSAIGVDERKLPQLPTLAELTPLSLSGFRLAYPRLPSSSPSDLAALEAGKRGRRYRSALGPAPESLDIDVRPGGRRAGRRHRHRFLRGISVLKVCSGPRDPNFPLGAFARDDG